MNSFVVWVLVVVLRATTINGAAVPVVIDNIASQVNCEALGRSIVRAGLKGDDPADAAFRCFAVRKVR